MTRFAVMKRILAGRACGLVLIAALGLGLSHAAADEGVPAGR
jgi:hypothetical protein